MLISLLISMILLSSGQIVLRNFFDIGIIWIDPLLRVLVLWTALVGATVASRENKHIRIDLLSRYFERNTLRLIQSLEKQAGELGCQPNVLLEVNISGDQAKHGFEPLELELIKLQNKRCGRIARR